MLEALMCFRAFFKRQHRIDYRFKQPAAIKLQRAEEIRFAAHERSEQRELPRKKIAKIDFRVVTSCRAASHQASAESEAADAYVPGSLPHMFDDHIPAAAVRHLFNFFGDTIFRVQNHRVGAEFLSLQ